MSSGTVGREFGAAGVVSVTCMLAREMGWSPSLVTMRRSRGEAVFVKFTENIFALSEAS